MEENKKAMRLREWLIAQIDSGKYSGLNWENKEKNMFRVPWKHAAKQDYNQHEDAALFKAWAVYKGKFLEGRDRVNPSAWKTRLRCALNKSCDFQEVPERSQLDISEPYKVYRIRSVGYSGAESPGKPVDVLSTQPSVPLELSSKLHQEYGSPMADGGWLPRRYTNGKLGDVRTAEPVRESAHLWSSLGAPGIGSPVLFGPVQNPSALQITDFRLRVRLFYRGQLVQDVTSTRLEGCWILHGPIPAEGIHGAELVLLPSPTGVLRAPHAITMAMARLLHHLQRGVLVWATPDGVFVKRFCQGRVYWGSPRAQHWDQPNKLEREKTCKLLDGPIFLQELAQFLQGGAPEPCCQIELCFGEEFPDSGQSKAKKLIMAQIEPLFARNLMTNFQRSSVEAKPPLKSLGTVTAY